MTEWGYYDDPQNLPGGADWLIVLNVLAGWLGLATWYGFLGSMTQIGVLQAIKALRVWDWLFLFAVYPACLGAFTYVVLRCRV